MMKRARMQLADLVSMALRRRYALGIDQDERFGLVLEDVVERRCDPYGAAERLLDARP